MPGFVWGFTHTHTQAGGRERGRGQGQPATSSNGEIRGKTTKAGNGQGSTTSRQNKGRKTLEGEEKAQRNPTLARRKSKQRKAEQATKQSTTLSCRDFLHCFVHPMHRKAGSDSYTNGTRNSVRLCPFTLLGPYNGGNVDALMPPRRTS